MDPDHSSDEYQASRELIQARIQAVADHGQLVMGPEVAELEQRLAQYVGARHCIAVASATEALALALGIGAGDEVVTTAFAPGAGEAIALVGARPVFADIDRATCNLDAAAVDAAVTARTRAILPVSLYGQPADMDELNAIARRRGLQVVEDAAHSFGATYGGRRSCNLSAIGCTSFYPGRPLGCSSDGGAVFTSDDTLAGRMRALRARALRTGARRGPMGPMDTLQCAIVLARLERFDLELAQRQRAAAAYDSLLCGRVQRVGLQRDRTSAFAQYTVVLDERERVQAALRAAGIPTAVHNQMPGLARGAAGAAACPVAREMAGKVLSLPIGSWLGEAAACEVAQALLRVAGDPVPAPAAS
jgi:UDP-2-acetamido-2-deoxy-ribo-hexuluronate aminotransferase